LAQQIKNNKLDQVTRCLQAQVFHDSITHTEEPGQTGESVVKNKGQSHPSIALLILAGGEIVSCPWCSQG